ncbi:MAG: hypothetical protein LBK68_00785 [Candidatus Margulisbacteria bacterium]|jgi:hypothetical protein|nr:hypothetical protein [Candidatus Margulisiibacteriota bacterium]
MFNKLINDEQNYLTGSGGGNPLNLLRLGLVSLFGSLFLFGCLNPFTEEVTKETEFIKSAPDPVPDHIDQLIPYGDLTAKLAATSGDTVEVTVRSSRKEDWSTQQKELAGLKILLDKYYKNSSNAEEIKFTFEGLTGENKKFDFKRLIVTLLDAKTKNYDHLGNENLAEYAEYMRSAIFVPLYRMNLDPSYNEPYAWDNPRTYGVSVDLDKQEVTLDLSQRDVLIHNLMHRDPDTKLTNITISEIGDRFVKFSVRDTRGLPPEQKWSYLGLDLKNQFGIDGQIIRADGGVSFALKNTPADVQYRVVLENSAKEKLIFYPEEHPGIKDSSLIPLSYFHEDFFAAELGAKANFTEGALQVNFAGKNSRVTVTDKSETKTAVDLRQNYTGQQNDYLKLTIAAGTEFDWQKFLLNVRPTLSCIDASGVEKYYSLDKQLSYTTDQLAIFAVEDTARGCWNINIPLSCVDTGNGLPAAALTVTGISLAATDENFTEAYNILAIELRDDGTAPGHIIPFHAVDRNTPFIAAGISLCSESAAMPDLELRDFVLQASAAEGKIALDYLRQEKSLVSKGEAVSLVFYTGDFADKEEKDFHSDPEGLETAYRVKADWPIVDTSIAQQLLDEQTEQEGE